MAGRLLSIIMATTLKKDTSTAESTKTGRDLRNILNSKEATLDEMDASVHIKSLDGEKKSCFVIHIIEIVLVQCRHLHWRILLLSKIQGQYPWYSPHRLHRF